MADKTAPSVELYFNTFERTIQYKGVQKIIKDDFWQSDILPILFPLWDSAKDRLELFAYKDDGTYLIQRCKYKKNFKTGESSWVSYEFDPAGAGGMDVVELRNALIDKFIDYKNIVEISYEEALIAEYARTNHLSWKKINLVRKFLLQDSDHIMCSDYDIEESTKNLWKQYRQYIRDIPDLQSVAAPIDVVFPITPDEYLKRKELYISPLVTEKVGDQGINDDYLTSSYHFWKMNTNTLTTFSQRMSFYIAAKVATSDHEYKSSRVMVSDFIQEFTANPDTQAERINNSNDQLNKDFIEELLTKIETGEL